MALQNMPKHNLYISQTREPEQPEHQKCDKLILAKEGISYQLSLSCVAAVIAMLSLLLLRPDGIGILPYLSRSSIASRAGTHTVGAQCEFLARFAQEHGISYR